MNRTPRVPSLLLIGAVVGVGALGALGGCARDVAVDLQITEPCGQENLALNGATSFLLKSAGASVEGAASFTAGGGASIPVGLGDGVTMTLTGYQSDITASAAPLNPTEPPIAVGRTAPLRIAEDTSDISANILVGRVDSFGGAKAADDTCAQLQSGVPVAGRHAHTTTFVPGLNKVLIVGGAVFNTDGSERFLETVELFDPATNTSTALPSLNPPRAYHTANLLPDGRVVLIGGFSTINGAVSAVRSGVVIDAASDAPYRTFEVADARAHHTATLLEDVDLLVVAGGCKATGCDTTSAGGTSTTSFASPVELIDTTTFTARANVPANLLVTPRAMHKAVAFPGGQRGFVVLSGGLNANGTVNTIEVLQLSAAGAAPIANIFSDDLLGATGLVRHTMTARGNQFIITGGQSSAPGGVLDDNAPGTNAALLCGTQNGISCTPIIPMNAPRFGHEAVLLASSQLLVLGGVVPLDGGTVIGAERYNPAVQTGATVTQEWQLTSSLGLQLTPRQHAAVTTIGGNEGGISLVMYSGGHSSVLPYTTAANIELYFGR